ncbi:hypothetical protein V7S43_005959 [Phytophthora oleae]|uniref:Protein Lines N-terminal domain-containing protein n=1 Tax=Phytophthora oleae TaxID=2107226 RepID=A0ABD3FRW4_9STRA
MDWYVAIRRISECSAALRSCRGGFSDILRTLLGYLDHEDVLVVYAAKEELRKALADGRITETQCVNSVVIAILDTTSSVWGREASGLRFQLLQHIVKIPNGDQAEAPAELATELLYLQVVMKNLEKVGVMTRSVFTPRHHSESGDLAVSAAVPYSVQYEALAFLSELVKRLDTLKIDTSVQETLIELVTRLMGEVFVTMDYASQPTFVSCAVLHLVDDFQRLVKFWKDKRQDGDDVCLETQYSKCIEWCLVWLNQSSCTSNALRLLNDKESSNMASQKALVAKSSRYPFLQQWFLCLSRMGVTYIEALAAKPKSLNLKWLQPASLGERPRALERLPTRQQLFVVLAEQDDIMIEVLNGITRSAALVESVDGVRSVLSQQFPSVSAYMIAEYDPDLLFADLIATLGRDHLVLLDLLISNETQVLEYLLRYTRRLSANWNTSKPKLETGENLESVMSVLIRLRLEIDRLVAADLFPYNAGPLMRRLLAIEHHYEEG